MTTSAGPSPGCWGAVKNRVTRHNPGVFLQFSAALAARYTDETSETISNESRS